MRKGKDILLSNRDLSAGLQEHLGLVNKILLLSNEEDDIRNFLVKSFTILINYFAIINMELTSSLLYFFETKINKYQLIENFSQEEDSLLSNILEDFENERDLIDSVKYKLKWNTFICIFVEEKMVTKRTYGIFLLRLKHHVESRDFDKTIKLSKRLSFLLSELFTRKFQKYLDGIRNRVYVDCTRVKGFKDKVIYYHILKGLRRLIPFDHSATFFLFNSRQERLQVYAEVNSFSNPARKRDEYYGNYFYPLTKYVFDNMPSIPQIIELDNGADSYKWLNNIVKYKGFPIKNILFQKCDFSPILDDVEPNLQSEFQILGIVVLCNQTKAKFIQGDAILLDKFINSDFKGLLSVIKENSYKVSFPIDLSGISQSDIYEAFFELEKRIKTHLFHSLIREGKKGDDIFCFITNDRNYGNFKNLKDEVKHYLLSNEFSQEVNNSLYGILNTTEHFVIKDELFGQKWNTFIAVKVPNATPMKHLCILRKEYFNISEYDRMKFYFLSEHIGLVLSDLFSHQENTEFLKHASEYIREIVNLGINSPHISTKDYLGDLLNIAINHTNSNAGNIYIVDNMRSNLILMAEKHNDAPRERVSFTEKGVVPYVANRYQTFKNGYFYIPDIPKFIATCPEIGYIFAIKNAQSELTVPMIFGNKLWGILNVESYHKDNYDEHRISILLNIAQKATEIWQQNRLLAILEITGNYLIRTLELQSTFEDSDKYYDIFNYPLIQQLIQIATEGTLAHSTTVRFLDEAGEKLVIYCQSGRESKNPIINLKENPDCIVSSAIRKKEILDIPDVFNIDKKKYPDITYFSTREGTVSEYAVPLRFLNRYDGVLNVESGILNAFGENDKLIYKTISRLIELSLIHRYYITRRRVLDYTNMVSLGAHRVKSYIEEAIEKAKDLSCRDNNWNDDLKNYFSYMTSDFAKGTEVILGSILTAPKYEKQKVKMHDLMYKIKDLSVYRGVQADLQVKIYPEIQNSSIVINMEQFSFIMKNLLDNAYGYGYSIKLEISLMKNWNGNLLILIKDNGPGIDEDVKNKLFKIPIGKNSFGCFMSGVVVNDLEGRIYVKETGKDGTTIAMEIPLINKED